MAEERLVVGTAGTMTTGEAGTATKTAMTDGTTGRGAPETITPGMITGGRTEVNHVLAFFMEQTLGSVGHLQLCFQLLVWAQVEPHSDGGSRVGSLEVSMLCRVSQHSGLLSLFINHTSD